MDDHLAAARAVTRAAAEGDALHLPQRLCRTLEMSLGMDAVSLSLLTDTPARQLLGVSNGIALRLEEVQFTMAEGPCVTAASSGRPAFADDLHRQLTDWPLFGAAVCDQLPEIGAVFAFPLRFAGSTLGAADLVRLEAGPMGDHACIQAAHATDAAADALRDDLKLLLLGGELPPWQPTEVLESHWATTHRAIGMLAARLRIDPGEALARMRAKAFATGASLAQIAARLLAQPPDG
ncbi:GAF and ANTAR domain-containing protein [Actinomycetota bacterium Odt1-20B]